MTIRSRWNVPNGGEALARRQDHAAQQDASDRAELGGLETGHRSMQWRRYHVGNFGHQVKTDQGDNDGQDGAKRQDDW